MRFLKSIFGLSLLLILAACATNKLQIAEKHPQTFQKDSSKISHSFYLIGDAGNSELGKKDPALAYLEEEIKKANKQSTLIFLGDNVYEKGIPKKKKKTKYKLATHRLQVQTDIAKQFPGKALFIPGNHDWYSGLKGLKEQEKLVEEALGKNSFLPENGCPIERVEINENISLIIVDTHWYVTNWNHHPNINDKCDIKTRATFFEELESAVKKSQGKTTLIALHHPMFTNGPHGGYFSFNSHLKPVPILGTAINLLRKTTGISNADQQNKKYNELRKRIITICQQNEKVVFVSGHEHSLQYIIRDNIPQIVSGSGSKTSAVKNTNGGIFGYGENGFARLDVYENGASTVHFYSAKDKKIVFETTVFKADKNTIFTKFANTNLASKKASIYTEQEVTKSTLFTKIWGERYRNYFGTKVLAPAVSLDTLYGGLTSIRRGGGHQSKSLRLKDKKGSEYVMRALRKNAVQYLQAVVFKDQYVEGQLDNTLTEELLMDVFTGSHPYAPFTIDKLAEAIDIYHTKPVLYFVPKQQSLGEFNEDYGDELYMIEERTDDGHGDKKNFGFSDELISTDDLRKNLAKDKKYSVDEETYIRARLFDMLIGDWDRHQDQWRWATFKDGKKVIYKPVPRDRDQAFSIFGDGLLLHFLTNALPALKGMRSYDEELKNPKWFSYSAYPLDMALINQSTKNVWDAQVARIQSQITDNVIDEAFKKFPKEVQDETINEIKRKLQGRRKNLQKISDRYFNYINEFQVIVGTNNDDWFDIERFKNGDTKITVYSIKDGKKGAIIHQKTYHQDRTKEIWLYGLDDDDTFYSKGENGNKSIKIKIIGGLNNDVYDLQTTKNIKIFDQKSSKNTFKTTTVRKKLTDDYSINTYDFTKLKNNAFLVSPSFGYNPDDGIKVGVKNTILTNGLVRNPFTKRHIISGHYYFATQGYELNYEGEFANVFNKWNVGIDVLFTSPNFARNFFGFGNNAPNPEAKKEEENRDFNRVRIEQLKAGTFMKWRGYLGAEIKIGAQFQRFEVERTVGRFLETQFAASNRLFSDQSFMNVEASYHFSHADNNAFTTLGMAFETKNGFTSNLNENRHFFYNITSLAMTHKITSNGRLVLASKVKGHFIFGKDFEFYQAATLGANEGLRGYRNERFHGKNAFYHSTDLRFTMRKLTTGLLPLNIGVYGGFDYGMVWGTPTMLTVLPNYNLRPNTSAGGGVFFNAADLLVGSIGLFSSKDGARFNFSVGFDF